MIEPRRRRLTRIAVHVIAIVGLVLVALTGHVAYRVLGLVLLATSQLLFARELAQRERIERALHDANRELETGQLRRLRMLPLVKATARDYVRRSQERVIAAPIVGGMITSTIHVLIITPVIFYIMKVRALRKGTLNVSGMAL